MELSTLYEMMKSDCKNCFGFCCRSLYFSKIDGFPENKIAGKACSHLQKHFTCDIHEQINALGLKGCRNYECFGAGQLVAKTLLHNEFKDEESSLYDKVFHKIFEVQEILWYLCDAYQHNLQDRDTLKYYIDRQLQIQKFDAHAILQLDVNALREEVNVVLRKTSDNLRGKSNTNRRNHLGENFSNRKLVKEDFRGSLLIGANLENTKCHFCDFIAADIRDANLCGADLSDCLYLTQAQVNSAKGDKNTKLPKHLHRPTLWKR